MSTRMFSIYSCLLNYRSTPPGTENSSNLNLIDWVNVTGFSLHVPLMYTSFNRKNRGSRVLPWGTSQDKEQKDIFKGIKCWTALEPNDGGGRDPLAQKMKVAVQQYFVGSWLIPDCSCYFSHHFTSTASCCQWVMISPPTFGILKAEGSKASCAASVSSALITSDWNLLSILKIKRV